MIDIKIIFIYSMVTLVYCYATIEVFEKILEGIQMKAKKPVAKKVTAKKEVKKPAKKAKK